MKQKLQWLEVMRAAAACWVLLHHANLSTSYFVGSLGWGKQFVANGYLGVDFFFVLSGFIIAFSSNRLLERGQGLGDYAKARIIRIYVPYLPIGIGMYLLYLLVPGLSDGNRTPGLLTSLTLLPSVNPPALSVAWTLIHEMLFYTLFSLFFVSRRALWVVLAAWALLIGAQAWLGPPLGREGWGYFLSPLNLSFLLGVGVYYLTRKGISRTVAMASGLFGLIVLLLEAGQMAPDRVLLALGFAGLIVCASSDLVQRWNPGRFMLLVGAASYSIYLVHNEVESAAIRVVKHFMPHVAPVPAFFMIAVCGFLAGLAYYYFYERHALALVRKLVSPHRREAGAELPARPSVAIRSSDELDK